MKNTDYIDLSNGVQPFEGLVPSFGKNMGEEYMVGKRSGATDYLEVIDCEAVKDYIEENVATPEHEGQFASFEGFISEKALEEKEDAQSEETKESEVKEGDVVLKDEITEEPTEQAEKVTEVQDEQNGENTDK